VTSYDWASLPTYIPFADFDVVIVNLAALGERTDSRAPSNIPAATEVGRTLFSSETELVVIRDCESHEEIDWFWSPIRLITVEQSGEVVRDISSEWSWYFNRLREYAHYLTGAYRKDWPADDYFRSLSIPANTYDLAIEAIASTRDGRAIAIQAELIAINIESYRGTEVTRSSPVFVLPTLYGLAASEVANLILQERYGLEITTAAPDWSANYVLPSHAPVLGELKALRQTIVEAQARLPEAEKREAHAARFQALLFEGDDVLEPIVREALGVLGGAVVGPTKKGVEDGRVTSPDGTLYIIEIKGLTGPIKRGHVRQLQDWVTAVETDQDIDCRGLLVANVYRMQPPEDRAAALTGDVVSVSRRFSHAVVTTTQLFQAVAALERGILTQADFWQALEGARGLVELPEPRVGPAVAPVPEK
jgi:hypothetical protein